MVTLSVVKDMDYYESSREQESHQDYYTEGKKVKSATEGKLSDFDFRLEKNLKRVGFDVTLSAPKSVSLAHALLGDKRVLKAHEKAVSTTNKYIEENLAFTRQGAGGKNLVQADGCLFKKYTHHLNRLNEPQLHTHSILFNRVRRATDGKLTSLEPLNIFRNQKVIDEIYKSELAKNIKKLGYEIEIKRDNNIFSFEIKGFPDKVIEAFSQRKKEVLKTMEKKFANLNIKKAKARELANIMSRPPKLLQENKNLEERWKKKLNEIGFSIEDIKKYVKKRSKEASLNKVSGIKVDVRRVKTPDLRNVRDKVSDLKNVRNKVSDIAKVRNKVSDLKNVRNKVVRNKVSDLKNVRNRVSNLKNIKNRTNIRNIRNIRNRVADTRMRPINTKDIRNARVRLTKDIRNARMRPVSARNIRNRVADARIRPVSINKRKNAIKNRIPAIRIRPVNFVRKNPLKKAFKKANPLRRIFNRAMTNRIFAVRARPVNKNALRGNRLSIGKPVNKVKIDKNKINKIKNRVSSIRNSIGGNKSKALPKGSSKETKAQQQQVKSQVKQAPQKTNTQAQQIRQQIRSQVSRSMSSRSR